MKRFISSALLFLAVLATGCTQIDTGNVGVKKTGGQYSAEEVNPGWNFSGFSTIYEVSGKENVLVFDGMKPKTADQITIEDLDIDVYVRLNPQFASETMTRLAGDLGKNQDGELIPGFNYVTREARNVVYDEAAKIKASDAQLKRNDLVAGIVKTLQQRLDEGFKPGWWVVTNANLRNLTVDSALEAKIKAAAGVDYEIAQKQKQVELANAEANRLRAEAQGRADAASIEAKALSGQAGSDYLKKLELENQAAAIKKWDGKLPTTQAGGVTPFISIK